MRYTVVTIAAAVVACATGIGCTTDRYVRVEGNHFVLQGRIHRFVGVNFWQAVHLAAPAPLGDRGQLLQELDHLQKVGVSNIRILAGFEGPDNEPYRVTPAMMISPGEYNDAVLDGLDFLMAELARRRMHAVVALTNFWEWSGGMAQYVAWHQGGEIPYPATHDWRDFCDYAARFYECAPCQQSFRTHVAKIIGRVNRHTGRRYRDEPAVFAWQLANEPRYYPPEWIDRTAKFIKSHDPNHMVTTGSEGEVGGDLTATHESPFIDYITVHIWPQNWGWFDPKNPATYEDAESKAREYFKNHEAMSMALGKPLVLEEFGLAQDWQPRHNCFDPESPTTLRDRFFEAMYECVFESAASGGPASGSNLWVWSGASRPGKPAIGDPPHERPGWYSVYSADRSTLRMMRHHAEALQGLTKKPFR